MTSPDLPTLCERLEALAERCGRPPYPTPEMLLGLPVGSMTADLRSAASTIRELEEAKAFSDEMALQNADAAQHEHAAAMRYEEALEQVTLAQHIDIARGIAKQALDLPSNL